MMQELGSTLRLVLATGLVAALPSGGSAQDSDVQKKLSNPVASLTIVPIQVNYDAKIGPVEDGHRITTNVQPVIPVKLDSQWSLVVRTIVPVISQNNIFPTAADQFGLGDTLQSFFFVPQTVDGFTWGVGPAIQWRTGTDRLSQAANGRLVRRPLRFSKPDLGRWVSSRITSGRLRANRIVST